MLDPTKKVFQLNWYWKQIYYNKWIIFIFLLQYFIRDFSLWFTLLPHMVHCHILIKSRPIVFFGEGVITSFFKSSAILSPRNKNADDNEHNTQSLFLYLKTYKLESPGTYFLILYFFVRPRGSSKGHFSYSSNNLA